MSIDIAELRKLPVAERIELAEALWDSIAEDPAQVPGLSEAQRLELRRRMMAGDANPEEAVSWESVRAELLPPPVSR